MDIYPLCLLIKMSKICISISNTQYLDMTYDIKFIY